MATLSQIDTRISKQQAIVDAEQNKLRHLQEARYRIVPRPAHPGSHVFVMPQPSEEENLAAMGLCELSSASASSLSSSLSLSSSSSVALGKNEIIVNGGLWEVVDEVLGHRQCKDGKRKYIVKFKSGVIEVVAARGVGKAVREEYDRGVDEELYVKQRQAESPGKQRADRAKRATARA